MAMTKRTPWLCVGLLVACREKAAPSSSESVSADPPSASVSADRLPPGKLLEGDVVLFGLRLPRGFTITESYGSTTIAVGQSNPDDVAEYLRARVQAKHVELGQGKLTFPTCTVLGSNHPLRIEVAGQGFATRLFVRDLARPVAQEQKSPEERWREVGLSPDGNLLNAQDLE